jgi:hypothetical protein
MTTICCVCNRVEKKGEWNFPEQYICGQVSHGYCPACFQDMLETTRSYFRGLDRDVAVFSTQREIFSGICG